MRPGTAGRKPPPCCCRPNDVAPVVVCGPERKLSALIELDPPTADKQKEEATTHLLLRTHPPSAPRCSTSAAPAGPSIDTPPGPLARPSVVETGPRRPQPAVLVACCGCAPQTRTPSTTRRCSARCPHPHPPLPPAAAARRGGAGRASDAAPVAAAVAARRRCAALGGRLLLVVNQYGSCQQSNKRTTQQSTHIPNSRG